MRKPRLALSLALVSVFAGCGLHFGDLGLQPPGDTPTIVSLSPYFGTIVGGVPIAISGDHFDDGATVSLGGVACTSVTVTSSSLLHCTTPTATATGPVDVNVTNPDGQSAVKANGFYYVDFVPDTWIPASTTFPAPFPGKSAHSAVWSGTQMIVWGGKLSSADNTGTDTGALFDPIANSWAPMNASAPPSPRFGHTAVWTGSEMIVWGGTSGSALQSGARFNPSTNTWTALSLTGAPSARAGHTALWTGSAMIVWGGAGASTLGDGALYYPATDSWSPMASSGAPSARAYHTAVWTGSKMIVWGGETDLSGTTTGDGAIYDPASNTWSSLSSTGAPLARYGHSAVWTGSTMIVWGGLVAGNPTDTGGVYQLSGNSWSATSTTSAPQARADHTAVWTGSRMLVWGGDVTLGSLGTGSSYDPVGDAWSSLTTINAPAARSGHTALWTGALMVVWGGQSLGAPSSFDDGGSYVPR